MNELTADQSAGKVVRTAQILRGAMLMGTLVIAGVLLTIRQEPAVDANAEVLVAIGLAAAVGTMVAAFVVPRLLSGGTMDFDAGGASISSGVPPGIAGAAGAWTTGTIVRGAILEGGIVINLVLWFISGSWILLAAAATGWVLLAATFPTRMGWEDFLHQAEREMV